MIWEAIRAVYPFDLFIVVMMVWTVIQIAGLFPSLQYWPALRVSYILPPLPEDTAHLTDKPSKKSDVKAKDSMVVRYGKVTAYELTRVERGGLFGLTLTVTQGLFLGVAFVWVLTQLPEPFTLLRSAVTPVLIMATVTCLYVLATVALLGDANTSYKWQLSAIFGIVFGSLSFAFLLENTDELLDIPLYQGLDEEFTRRFNLPLLPGEDDDDTTAFDRRQSLTRVILALVTGVLAFCHFFVSVRRAAHHHRLVYSSFHGKFFKGLEYLYLTLVALLLVLWFRTPTEFLTDYLHLDQTVDDTCHAWLGTSKFGMVLCRTLSWTGLGARDLYHTARWCVQGSVVALCWLLFRPLLSAYTHRVAAVMRSLLFMHQLYGTEAGSLHGLMQREATGVMQGLGVVCVELSALPLLLTWHWHYAGHWLVDYLTFISLLAHGVTMVLTFITLALSDTDATRPAFFDTLLRWWDRRSATPRNINKKLRIKKK